MICSKSVELETKEPLLESSEEPSTTFPFPTFAAADGAAEGEDAPELPLRNFDPAMSENEHFFRALHTFVQGFMITRSVGFSDT